MNPLSDEACALVAEFLNATRYEPWQTRDVKNAYFRGELNDLTLYPAAALKWKQAQVGGYYTRAAVHDASGFIVGSTKVPVHQADIEWEDGR